MKAKKKEGIIKVKVEIKRKKWRIVGIYMNRNMDKQMADIKKSRRKEKE